MKFNDYEKNLTKKQINLYLQKNLIETKYQLITEKQEQTIDKEKFYAFQQERDSIGRIRLKDYQGRREIFDNEVTRKSQQEIQNCLMVDKVILQQKNALFNIPNLSYRENALDVPFKKKKNIIEKKYFINNPKKYENNKIEMPRDIKYDFVLKQPPSVKFSKLAKNIIKLQPLQNHSYIENKVVQTSRIPQSNYMQKISNLNQQQLQIQNQLSISQGDFIQDFDHQLQQLLKQSKNLEQKIQNLKIQPNYQSQDS